MADLEEDRGDDELQDSKDVLSAIKEEEEEEEKMDTEDAAAADGEVVRRASATNYSVTALC